MNRRQKEIIKEHEAWYGEIPDDWNVGGRPVFEHVREKDRETADKALGLVGLMGWIRRLRTRRRLKELDQEMKWIEQAEKDKCAENTK